MEPPGIDFSLYREKTIKRRILRRLALRNIDSLAEYASRLENDSDELTALQRDLLICVTSFFRDPESFESLKTSGLPAHSPGAARRTRRFASGCRDAPPEKRHFSIAISLPEYLNETGASFPVQIFASDISEQAIEKARAGKYLENIAADMSAERLNRYFTKIEGRYQINKNLREMCVFTRHNLLADPPFSKLDLISCRNVLIYLASVQKNIIPLFHYALKPNGFLMLGASETAAFPELFSVVDREHRIYCQAGNRAQAVSVSHADRARPSAAARRQGRVADRRRKCGTASTCARRSIAYCSRGTARPVWWWTKSWRSWRSAARPVPFSRCRRAR